MTCLPLLAPVQARANLWSSGHRSLVKPSDRLKTGIHSSLAVLFFSIVIEATEAENIPKFYVTLKQLTPGPSCSKARLT